MRERGATARVEILRHARRTILDVASAEAERDRRSGQYQRTASGLHAADRTRARVVDPKTRDLRGDLGDGLKPVRTAAG